MQQVASNRKLPESDCFENLLDLVREGKIPEETINEAVRRV
jgi:beta-glucosidase